MEMPVNPDFGQQTHKNERHDAKDGVATWFQEHSNLCMVIAALASHEPDTREKIRARMRASLDRGRHLVATLGDTRDLELTPTVSAASSSSHPVGLGAVVGSSAPASRRSSVLPLSGHTRFEEGRDARQSLPAVARTGGFGPLSNAPAPRVAPLPSRTYLKKSNS